MKAKRIAIDAMMSAMYVTLAYFSINLGFAKITFECFPVIIAGLMLGPVDGLIVGAIGTFIYQLTGYGITVTTLLWMLPYMACGLVCGLYAKRFKYYNSLKQIWIIIIISELLVFAFNTLAIFVDSKVYGYYTFAYVWGAVWVRLAVAAIKSVIYGFITMPVLNGMAQVSGRKK